MDISFFLRGLIIGLSIAAPVGPIGILCIRRTLAEGRLSGFVSGLGAATADGFYGSVAAFGLTFISNFLVSQQFWFRPVGGIFLLYLGIKTFLAKPREGPALAVQRGLLNAYGSTLLLTLTNPITILSFAAIFAGLGLVSTDPNYLTAGITVIGVFLGSSCWWFLLSGGVTLFRNRFKPSGLLWINRISGLIIAAFGLLALVGVFFS